MLIALWIVSATQDIRFGFRGVLMGVERGAIQIGWGAGTPGVHWWWIVISQPYETRYPLRWWFESETSGLAGATTVNIPIWILLLPCIGYAVWAWRSDAKLTVAGSCKACGYSLAGIDKGAKCPECGSTPAAG